ncbi:helicase associated domain-containing protein [Streptomyces sp. SID2888]|uniref:helicase associated domain-containing protein n=1 Tax=Streptomyces sp. SID2888 TaxID=2690256 RepID=UPI00136AE505|nr:helicase associated domain-containing protein [Streptomyces sp. SID2888]MYV49587.1 hypothetical protein [Streptomyces sp. SID2888]
MKGSGPFLRGLAALQQYAQREGHVRVPRQWTEHLPTASTGAAGAAEGGGDVSAVRLGVWLSNTRQRRENLTGEQRQALAALGVDWAA